MAALALSVLWSIDSAVRNRDVMVASGMTADRPHEAPRVRGWSSGNADAERRGHALARSLERRGIEWSGHVLDVGCGEGGVLRALAGYGGTVVGVERATYLLDRAHSQAAKLGCHLAAGDATALPFGEATFDLVILYDVLEHVPQWAKAVMEAGRVVRPGGTVIVTAANPRSPITVADDPHWHLPFLALLPQSLARRAVGVLRLEELEMAHPVPAFPSWAALHAAFETAGLTPGLVSVTEKLDDPEAILDLRKRRIALATRRRGVGRWFGSAAWRALVGIYDRHIARGWYFILRRADTAPAPGTISSGGAMSLVSSSVPPRWTPARVGATVEEHHNRSVDQPTAVDLSVVIPALNERENLESLLPRLRQTLTDLSLRHEVIVVDAASADGTAAVVGSLGARLVPQLRRGYGEAIRLGTAAAAGEYVLTMDADLSHEPEVISALWAARDAEGIAIASRYVPGGAAHMPLFRLVLSRILNVVFARGLSLNVRDLSSGFRLYPRGVFGRLRSTASDFDVLPEILVMAHAAGWQIREVPFRYQPRASGRSKARIIRLAKGYLGTFLRLWRLRNSIEAADYDERAFDSVIPLQRAWQRRRHAIVTARAPGATPVLDIGCGSSRILRDVPEAVGIDIKFDKLRYMRRYNLPLVAGSIFALPFIDKAFGTIVCSEVIEHIPAGMGPFREMARVHRKGGRLVLGTPDYGRRSWRVLEAAYRFLAPGGYADEHITQYRHETLRSLVEGCGYRYITTDYVFASEMILTFEKL